MSVDLVGYVDEKLRSRSVQGIYTPPLPLPLTPIEIPSGLSTVSSIEPAEPREIPRLKPQIPEPRNVMLDVLKLHLETERLAGKGAQIFDSEIKQSLAEIDRLSEEKLQALQTCAKETQNRATWSALSNVAQYVGSASMIALAASAGGVSAFCLGLAGVIGLSRRVAEDTNLLNTAVAWWTKSEESQQRIKSHIEMGTFYVQMGLGLAGGFLAWHSGSLAAAEITNETIKSNSKFIIGTASGIAGAGARIGQEYHTKQIRDIQARMKEIEGQMTSDHNKVTQDSTQMSKMIEAAQAESDELRKAIQALQISID